MFNPFYNKLINIYAFKEYEDERGITREGLVKIRDSIKADIQPYSTEKTERDYGYKVECTKRMFSDQVEELTEDCLIEYNSKFYKITSIPWNENHLEILLKETKDYEIAKA